MLSSCAAPLSPAACLKQCLKPIIQRLFFHGIHTLFGQKIADIITDQSTAVAFVELTKIIRRPGFIHKSDGTMYGRWKVLPTASDTV